MPNTFFPIRRRYRSGRTVSFAAVVALCALTTAGIVASQERRGATAHSAAAYAAPVTRRQTPSPAPPKVGAASSNELGRIPVLMYHSVGDPPLRGAMARFNRLGLSISADLFRRHLQSLYDGGFYPVNMRDLLSPRLLVPVGKTPVVLTFDDARASQFRYRKDGTLDPNCVVGVLEAFHKKHPDWPEKASFYVLPDSSYNPPPFGNKKEVKRKVDYLLSHGYEIANHSTTHHPMAHMDAHTLSWEMTTCARYFHGIEPKVVMDTMALPYGIEPKNKALLSVLLDDGTGNYHNRCILLAAGNPSYAPGDKRFNTRGVSRIGSEPGNIEHWIKVLIADRAAPLSANKTFRPYVSDGDPDTLTVPQSLAKYLDRSRLDGAKVVAYADTPPKNKSSAPTRTNIAAAAHPAKRG